jgi:protein phosphatase
MNLNLGLFIVADGMGGHSGGEVASLMAVKTVEEMAKDPEAQELSPREVLTKAYEVASQKIHDSAAANPQLAGMGTTMVTAYVRDNMIYIANVGDSRCYLFRAPHLWQITEDHSMLNEHLRAGLLSEDQAKNFVGRNVITRSVGYEREVHPDIIERQVEPGEVYLMCSDGLSGLVTDDKISQLLSTHSPEKMAKACVEQALAHGGDDNVSVMILHFPKA